MTLLSGGRRRGRMRRLAALLSIVLFGGITVGLGAAGASAWSLIPIAIHERVAATTWSDDGHPFKVLKLERGRSLTIDTALYDRMGGAAVKGEPLKKAGGDRTVIVGKRTVPLTLSSQFWKVVVTLSGVVALALWRHVQRSPARGQQPDRVEHPRSRRSAATERF
jgi:hypothetical protein